MHDEYPMLEVEDADANSYSNAAQVLKYGGVDELKALTPMQTVNETRLAQLFLDAARGAKEKIDQAEHNLWKTGSQGT